ncbi:MAG TPA: DUF4198 domain-containing protein [Thermoanaerobaculia bacterium]|jgi:uncharacterized GH25 family protein|nr:DUF4198 domain-containing protein [Thermoanaerobaculia bacterium]
MTRFAIALVALLAVRASAHDFWIEPSTFHPAVGDRVTAALRVGQKLAGDPLPNIPPLIDRFVLRGPAGERPVIGRAGADPAGIAFIAEGGLHWIGYQSNPYPVALEAAKFEDYLRDEGLERIVDARKKNGQSAAPGRERFYRCAKALLDTPGAATFDAPLGFTLELVPRTNPYAMKSAGDLPLALTFRGKPLANALVVAMSKTDPEKAVRARTDAKGRVTLPLAHAGFWLIKAVHMEAAPADSGVDWESWWASITFELPK